MTHNAPQRHSSSTTGSLSAATDDRASLDDHRDRFGIHFGWELALFILAGGLVFLLSQTSLGPFGAWGWHGLFLVLTPFLLAASAAAVSLRIGAPNFAVGPIALLAGWLFIDASNIGILSVVLGMAAAGFIGIVLATLVAWLRIPGWAASLCIGMGIGLWWLSAGGPGPLQIDQFPRSVALIAFGAAFGFSVLLGLIGASAKLRNKMSAIRDVPSGDKHGRGSLVFTGLLFSSLLAGAAGVAAAWISPHFNDGTAVPADGMNYTLLPLAAALLGGTSLYGRRGGFAGTALATTVLVAAMWFMESRELGWDEKWIMVIALFAGFVMTRVIEHFNLPADGDEDARAVGNLHDLADDSSGEFDDLTGETDSPLPRTGETRMGSSSAVDDDFATVGRGGSFPPDNPYGAPGHGYQTGSQQRAYPNSPGQSQAGYGGRAPEFGGQSRHADRGGGYPGSRRGFDDPGYDARGGYDTYRR